MKRLAIPILLASLAACRAREEAVHPAAAVGPTPTQAPRPALGFLDESREGTPVEGGTLRRRLVGEPATLNAVLQSGLPEQQVLQYVSRQIVDFDPRLEVVGNLAERWTVSDDGREYRFFLQRDAVWEDGTPVTSADAVFTIRRIVDAKVPSPVFKPLFEGLEVIEAIDPASFRARFRERDAFHLYAFALPL
ncbi:MAG TPA: ABC transporter substrate-binding protein, partial [Thermoanaerobaculia bacterium]